MVLLAGGGFAFATAPHSVPTPIFVGSAAMNTPVTRGHSWATACWLGLETVAFCNYESIGFRECFLKFLSSCVMCY